MKILISLMLLLFIAVAIPSFAQDPTGANTGTAIQLQGKPTSYKIAGNAGNHISKLS